MTTAVTSIGQAGPPLNEIPLLDHDQAAGLAGLFKILANDTRLRLLHALHRGGEVRVSDLAAEVGMTQQSVSNQLQRLLDRGILEYPQGGHERLLPHRRPVRPGPAASWHLPGRRPAVRDRLEVVAAASPGLG